MKKGDTGYKKIGLPPPEMGTAALGEALRKRRSLRDYTKKQLIRGELSSLLFAACGITDRTWYRDFRTAPSAGALYPIELYVVINNVEETVPGLYRYCAEGHALELIKEGDFRSAITRACLSQEMPGNAAVVLVLTSVFGRICGKYGERGYRYASMECGHISQNIYLAATALGLGSVAIGAFDDEDMNRLVDVDGEAEAVIYVHAVGNISSLKKHDA